MLSNYKNSFIPRFIIKKKFNNCFIFIGTAKKKIIENCGNLSFCKYILNIRTQQKICVENFLQCTHE